MNEQMIGQIAALGTAFCWAVTSLSFEAAGKRVGSLPLNLIRIVFAFIFFVIYSSIFHGIVLPVYANGHTWFWLLLSGLTGFVLGDIFLFRAFIVVGARISMLVYSSVPIITAILGRLFLDERFSLLQIVAMFATVAGIAIVTTAPRRADPNTGKPVRIGAGVLFAFLGSVGQALGLVLGRYGAPTYDAFLATQIRTIAGIVGFAVVVTVSHRWSDVRNALRDGIAMRHALRGSIFGPFLGVSLGLFGAQRAGTGMSSTIMATVPIILIPVTIVLFHERVAPREILGSLIAVGGVALLFLS